MKNGLLAGVALVAVLVCGCSDKKPLKIGFIGGLTGRNGDLGTAGRDGALLAFDSINAGGGIGGRTLELVIRDDKSDPEEAKRVVKELVKAGVSAIIGPMTSVIATVTIPIIDAAKIATISPTVSSSDFTGKDDYFLHLNLNKDTATATAVQLSEKMGIKNCALIYDAANKSYTGSVVTAFKTEFSARGGVVAAEQAYNSKEPTNLMELVSGVMARKPGSLFIIAGALDSAMICQQLKKLGSKVPIFLSEWSGTNEFLKTGGQAVVGARTFQHFNSDSTNRAFVAFRNDYTKRFGDPPSFAATYSHEAVSIIATALRKDANPAHIKGTITDIRQFQGLQGDISIDTFGDPHRSFSLMQVRDGRFAVVE